MVAADDVCSDAVFAFDRHATRIAHAKWHCPALHLVRSKQKYRSQQNGDSLGHILRSFEGKTCSQHAYAAF